MVTESKIQMDETTKKNIDSWLLGDYDDKTKEEIRKLQIENPNELIDSFYSSLSFGTGGLRGIMGVGCNRMNLYTVRAATQGLANYINKQTTSPLSPSVIIGYDSRRQSSLFATESAKVLAANDIKVYLFEDLRPTPLVSFGCRYKKCTAAIVITASHNPPEYNGYKVYWSDGAQVLSPHDKGIIDEVNKVQDLSQVKTTETDHQLIEKIGEELDKAYLQATNSLQHYPEENSSKGKDLRIVFSNLHGTGITLVPKLLKSWGFQNIAFVEEQKEPDGDFPTVTQPNPEETEAMRLGIEKLLEEQGDLLLGTDPDADRMGAIILNKGKPFIFNGNQIACICLYHLCEALTKKKKMPKNAAFITTIVSTDLFGKIVESYGKNYFEVLTGFKYIAGLIRDWENSSEDYEYLFGAEESYGYLLGSYARDKDAATACALISEAALHAKLQGKNLLDLLYEIYEKYGVYHEELHSIKFSESKQGREKMESIMKSLREFPPSEFNELPISIMEDYLSSSRTYLKTKQKEPLSLPKSNVLLFKLEDGSKIAIRPSGTEPKVKVYVGVVSQSFSTVEEGIASSKKHAESLMKSVSDKLR